MIKLVNVLKELVTTTEIICDKCGWNWKIKDPSKWCSNWFLPKGE